MNRIEFMAELEKLLQDIAAEERDEALQYYRDYFEDAGIENEQHIIAELESPQKVARTIKEGTRGRSEENSEYRETGYTDTRFEEKEMPAKRDFDKRDFEKNTETSGEASNRQWSGNLVKVLLIIAIIFVGAPIVFPVVLAVVCVIFALLISGFALLGALVIAAIAVMLGGFVMAVGGIVELFSFPPAGLIVCGAGLIVFVLGLVATVLLIKLCIVVFPAMFRGIVNICRRPLHGKENGR